MSDLELVETEAMEEQGDTLAEAEGQVESTEAPAEMEYNPGYEYEYGGEKHQFDEWVRPYITSKEVEDNFRNLYTQNAENKRYRDGFEGLHKEFEKIQKKYSEDKKTYGNISSHYNELKHYLSQGNYHSAFKKLGIDEKDIYTYVKERLQMDDKQRLQYDRYNDSQYSAYMAQQQREQAEQRLIEKENKEIEKEWIAYTTQPEVKRVIDAFNATTGNPQAFSNLVEGYARSQQSRGVEVGVKDSIAYALRMAAPHVARHKAPPMEGEVKGRVEAVASKSRESLPVVPTSSRTPVAPSRKKPSSLDELEKDLKRRFIG